MDISAIVRDIKTGRATLVCFPVEMNELKLALGLREEDDLEYIIADSSCPMVKEYDSINTINDFVKKVEDGDDYVVRFLLLKGHSVLKIVSQYYQYISKDEIEVMRYLLKTADFDSVIEFWFKTKTWLNAVDAYIENGVLLNTEKGFYVRKLEGG
ncbi:hypothetical protein SuUB38_17730 [Streptococcus uberis]|uniref:hypothetical protein n=1 Tax=Streptococcus uberis TaxID=1349 RepID=UPI002FE83F37